MTLARLGTTSLFLGVWTPLVALAIVWAAAGSGTPIVFALEGAGVDQIDRTAVALVFAPPLPYLFALAALGIGLAAQRAVQSSARVLEVRRHALRVWIAAGVIFSTASSLSLYAEHGTPHEPADDVHLALLLATWAWWATTATALATALALRGHMALVTLGARSRPVAGASLGLGVLTLAVASVAALPSATRADLAGELPVIDTLATETESIVMALAGTASPNGNARQGHVGGAARSGDGDDRYTVAECFEQLVQFREDDGLVWLQRTYRSVDVSEIAIEVGADICESEPRRGNLGGMFFDATKKRVISQIRRLGTARRNEVDVSLLASGTDIMRRGFATQYLQCLMEGLSAKDRALLEAVLLGDTVDEIAEATSDTRVNARKAIFRAKVRARARRVYCDKWSR